MATLKTITPTTWALDNHTATRQVTIVDKFNAFADSQKERHAVWFMVSLIVMGVLMLPVPAVLMYYYNAPLIVLGVTMTCFFGNIIANMGGAGIRTTLLFFATSMVIHLAMILAFTI
jgi:hypothetical protein